MKKFTVIRLANRRKMNPTRRRVKITAPKAAKTAKTLPKTLPKTVKSRRLEEEAGGNGKKMATSKEKPTIKEQCGKAPAAKPQRQKQVAKEEVFQAHQNQDH